ncbi:MAG: C40 family peptidase [bacterium]
MSSGIATIAVIPIRKEPSEQSEMTSQVLFGEHFTLLEKRRKWTLVRLAFDDYEGWIDSKMITPIDDDSFNHLNEKEAVCTNSIITNAYTTDSEYPVRLMPGSSLPGFDEKKKTFSVAGVNYKLDKDTVFIKHGKDLRNDIRNFSLSFMNAPYLWGGRTPFGMDCSGLTQLVYKLCGYRIPRDANKQVNTGRTLSFLNEAKPGDLAFFDNDDGNIVHVGLIAGPDKIIHASGRVRIDKIDHQGIYNGDIKQYTHKLRVIQNIID